MAGRTTPQNEQQLAPIIVARVGDVTELKPGDAKTVRQALANARADWDRASDVRVNGQKCENPDQALQPGDHVTVLGRIQGA